MSLNIKHKRSAVAASAPTPAQLEDGELAVNYNDTDPALYIKDSTGAVVRIAGEGAVGGDLQAVTDAGNTTTNDVLIGGTLPSSPNITLNGDGSIVAAADATIYGLTVGRGAAAEGSNTAVGRSALSANTTGLGNTAVGENALESNTTGRYSTAVGRRALQTNNGNSNTGIGQNALNANTIGARNTALGALVLQKNTEGNDNTALGYTSLTNNTTGSQNTAVGVSSLSANTEGEENTALGRSALNDNTIGNYNTAVGASALSANTKGEFNTAIGLEAGFFIEGSNNTILGAYKGSSAEATLSDTIIISAGTTERARCYSSGIWNLGTSAPVYADNTAAKAGGLVDGDLYRKADGTLMVVFT